MIDPAPVAPAPRHDVQFGEAAAVEQALDRSLRAWTKLPVRGRWLVNSHPKSGTHLLRNILLHCNSIAVFPRILLYDTIAEIRRAGPTRRIFNAHIPWTTYAQASAELPSLQAVLLLRHPTAIALALARAFYDANSTRADHLEMRERCSFEEILAAVVTGYQCGGQEFGPLAASLQEFSIAWLPEARFVLKFEDILAALRGDDAGLTAYFAPLLTAMFGSLPEDAAARIRAGSEGAISATYSRNAASPAQRLGPDDVYRLLPQAQADQLRAVAAAQLGY